MSAPEGMTWRGMNFQKPSISPLIRAAENLIASLWVQHIDLEKLMGMVGEDAKGKLALATNDLESAKRRIHDAVIGLGKNEG